MSDCVRKWAVFATNYSANRTYDIKGLAQVMDQVNPVCCIYA